MTALPNEVPQNKMVDPVTKFRTAYAKAMANVQISKDHTDTEGWRTLYADHAKAVADARRDLSKRLHVLADAVERGYMSEGDEKAIGDIKKAATELREAEGHWRTQTVEPVKSPVDVAERMLIDAMAEAKRTEDREPLTNVGLVELMRDAVMKSPKAAWDDESGTISIVNENQ